jgi:hypothetical protein
MRLLYRLYSQCDVFILACLACEAERSVARKRFLDEQQRFMGLGAAILEIGAVGPEKIRYDTRNQTELEPAVRYVVQHGGVLDDAQRIVERHNIAHGADAQPARARRRRGAVNRRRRHPAFVGVEVVLDAKSEVKAELVGKPELAPELLVALGGVHARLIPDVREMSEFHSALKI